jgi:hypothetical protein
MHLRRAGTVESGDATQGVRTRSPCRHQPRRESENGLGSMKTSRVGSWYGSGRRTTALMTLKIAVFTPMPTASVRIATAANPGERHRLRRAYLVSCASCSKRVQVQRFRTLRRRSDHHVNFRSVAIVGYSWAATAHIGAIAATSKGRVTDVMSARPLDAEELSRRHGTPIGVHTDLDGLKSVYRDRARSLRCPRATRDANRSDRHPSRRVDRRKAGRSPCRKALFPVRWQLSHFHKATDRCRLRPQPAPTEGAALIGVARIQWTSVHSL